MLIYWLLPAFSPTSGAGMDVQPEKDMGTPCVSWLGCWCRPCGKTFLHEKNHVVPLPE